MDTFPALAGHRTQGRRVLGRRGRIVVGSVAAVVVVATSTLVIARVTFERRIAGEVDALFAARTDVAPTIVTEAELAAVPEPVQRWLRWSQVVGKPRPVTIRLKQEGQFRLAEDRGWMPYTAEQSYTTDPPGFLWSARFKMAPLLSIVGRDRYADGTGSIDMRLLSLVPVARKSGGALDQGAMLRYLNETMWFPAAALSPSITWSGIDANSARATMSHGGVTASATFLFDDEGRLTTMTAQRNNDDRGRPEPWSTPISEYGEFEGVRVPVAGEGTWMYESGDFPYIRLRITAIEYNADVR